MCGSSVLVRHGVTPVPFPEPGAALTSAIAAPVSLVAHWPAIALSRNTAHMILRLEGSRGTKAL